MTSSFLKSIVKEIDPGIDHMSAMKIIDQIKNDGNELFMFKSYTGGLIAPESDNNLWNYKFTWNSRNVVLAGQGGDAKYIEENKLKQISYKNLFKNIEPLEIDEYGKFEAYAKILKLEHPIKLLKLKKLPE